jgi:hypothetical protein
MIRALTIITAVVALAVSAAPALAGSGSKAGPSKPHGIVVTKATDASSPLLRRASSGSSLADVLISGRATKTSGIIMRDGGVCDPIRHMGC